MESITYDGKKSKQVLTRFSLDFGFEFNFYNNRLWLKELHKSKKKKYDITGLFLQRVLDTNIKNKDIISGYYNLYDISEITRTYEYNSELEENDYKYYIKCIRDDHKEKSFHIFSNNIYKIIREIGLERNLKKE